MSKIFYDHLIIFEDIETKIGYISQNPEEKEELLNLIEEIIHHRIFECILDLLPNEFHQDFLSRFYQAPYDEGLLDYLREKTKKDIIKAIKKEARELNKEIIKQLA